MTTPTLRDRFSAWVESELRRQGVPQTDAWRERVMTHTHLAKPTAPSAGSAPSSPLFPSFALQVDLTDLHVTDDVAVAVVEALLRLYSTSQTETGTGSSEAALRGDWSVCFRRNDLTDASVPHLVLLVQSCQSLSRLDLRGNLFSASSKADMLSAMSGTPCDVVLDNGPVAQSTHSSSDSQKTPSPTTKKKEGADAHTVSSPPPPPAPEAVATILPTAVTASAVRRAGALTSVDNHPKKGVSPEATSSVATSRVSYASGNAEALRRRREGLFGKSRAASPGATSAVPAAAVADVEATKPPSRTPVTEEIPLSPVASGGDSQNLRTVDKENERHTSPSSHGSQGVAEASPVTRGLVFASTPPRPRVPPSSSSPFHDDPNPSIAQAERAADLPGRERRHEPFYGDGHVDAANNGEDRNDRLDLTSNLNPILDSVLDLAGTVAKDGRTLCDPDLFGDAESIWDVLAAYEDAVEESTMMMGSGEGQSHQSLGSDTTSARLPASLLSSRAAGGAFTALTVLNLSKNNLTELRVFPVTLLRLDVSSNQLVRLSGLEHCKMLTVLNARRNQLAEISGLERNMCLAHLFLGHNHIAVVEGLAHLLLLETLDLSFNQLRTQASLRALSLTSSLRHLLIRGNPIMTKLQNGFKPVLRNLCPSLLVIDDVKLSTSRFSDHQQMLHSALRQPDLIAASTGSPLTAQRSSSSRGGRALSSGKTGQTLLATSHAPPPSAHNSVNGGRGGGTTASDNALPDRNAMNLLHLLTRGVTAPTGYGDGTKVVQTANAMKGRAVRQAADQKRRKERELTEGGTQLRTAMMKKLAEASKEYLETTLVERMTVAQQHRQTSVVDEAAASGSSPPARASPRAEQGALSPAASPLPSEPHTAQGLPSSRNPSVASRPTTSVPRAVSSRPQPRRLSSAYGAVADPLEESPLPDVMGYTSLPPSVRHALTPSTPAAAEHGAPPRRASTRSAGRESTRRPTAAPVTQSDGVEVVLAPYTWRPSASTRHHHDPEVEPRSTRSSRARAQSAQQRRDAYTALATADVTLDAIYECHADGEVEDGRALPQQHARGRSSSPAGGYAALHSRAPADTSEAPAWRSRDAWHGEYGDGEMDDEIGLSPIPMSYSSQRRVAAAATQAEPRAHAAPAPRRDTDRRSSPALCPPPPMLSAPAAAAPASHTGRAERSARRQTSALVGTTRRISREAAAPAPSRASHDDPAGHEPVRIDAAQAQRVHTWSMQLSQDVQAVQMTLKTVVSLLETQRQSTMPIAEHSHELPRTYLEERRRSVKIIEESGMLEDITVPAEVALYYGFSKRELDGGATSASAPRSLPRSSHSRGATRSQGEHGAEKPLLQDWSLEESEREAVLRNVRVMGDAKTCLRYLLLLMGGGKERLLQAYVDQMKSIL